MKSIVRLVLAALLVSCLAVTLAPRPAAAHPMGNFTINQYSAIKVGADHVDVLYVVDMAEIPAFQELGTMSPSPSANPDKDLTQAQRDAYAARKSAELAKGLTLTLDGKSLPLTLGKTALTFPAGAGGLPTMRLEINLSAQTGAQKGTLAYEDSNYAARIGWKEIIATAGGGIALQNSSVPTTDRSDALRKYNPDFLSTPPTVTSATLSYAPGTSSATSAASTGAQSQPQQRANSVAGLSWAQGRADALTNLISQQELPLGAFLIALLVAFAFGAGHALSPGHGKTVVAAYLVGSRGTAKHAALLGLTVTISHTIGVFLLGLVVLYAANYILPEQLYPWLGFSSGLLVAVMGVTLFVQRWRAWKRNASNTDSGSVKGAVSAIANVFLPSQRKLALQRAGSTVPYAEHTHSHDEQSHTHDHDHNFHAQAEPEHTHDHDHDHSHTHDHEHPHEHEHSDPAIPHKHGMFSKAHTHLPADGQQVSLRSLLALGISGGIIPCPSALVVLLVAVATGKIALGLVLILSFSLGLAAVLTGIGLLMVYSRGLLSRFNFGGGILGRMPMGSAMVMTGLGLLIAFEALKSGGVLR